MNINTRSRIGILKKDGSIESIYCHLNGSLNGVGIMLNNCYTNYEKIKKLISLGNIEDLKEEITEISSNSKDNDITFEKNSSKAMIKKNLDEFNDVLFDTWVGFIYLFDEKANEWFYDYYSMDTTKLSLKSLGEYLYNKDKKPQAPIIGADGNIFNLIGICSRALKSAGHPDKAKEMTNKITNSGSYEEALSIMCEYIEPVDQNYHTLDDCDDFDFDL